MGLRRCGMVFLAFLALPLVAACSFFGLSSAQVSDTMYEPAILVGDQGSQHTLTLPPDLWRTFAREVHDTGRTLLLSDNPEYVSEPGIMYRDTFEGKARLYLYHATRGSRLLRYGVILRNHGETEVTVTLTRKGLAGPSTNYPQTGQRALARFWAEVLDEKIVLAPGEQRHLDTEIIYLIAGDRALVHAIYDVESDGPVEAAFVADDNIIRFLEPDLDNYEDLPPSGDRMRGTFAVSERYITFEVGDRNKTLYMAGNLYPPDIYIWGVDGVDGKERHNFGNYGLVYHLDVVMEVTQPKRIRLFLGPSFTNAGSCSLASTVLLTDGAHDDDAEKGKVLLLPNSKEARVVGLIGETVVLPEQPRVARLDFMPPGGSCLPALLFAQVEDISAEDAALWYKEHDR